MRLLIFMGSAGVTSAITTLVLMFMGSNEKESQNTLLFLGIGLVFLFFFWRSKLIDSGMRKIIKRILTHFTPFQLHDYSQLLGLCRGYSIGEVTVKKDSWLAGRRLEDLKLREEGVIVLGIYRKEKEGEVFLGVPDRKTMLLPGDNVICYGPEEVITRLSKREKGHAGEVEHREAMKRLITRKLEEKANEEEDRNEDEPS